MFCKLPAIQTVPIYHVARWIESYLIKAFGIIVQCPSWCLNIYCQIVLLLAHLDFLKLDCLNLMSADLPMAMTEGISYMQMWTLNSFLETKPILRNTFNKYLGKSRLLIFLLLFFVDLKCRGGNTRRKDNREVWNRVPLWLCFINIWYNPLPEWSFVWGN